MRYILSVVMLSALAFGLGCQSASSSSSTETKNENPAPAEKAAVTEKTVTKSHDEHEDDDAPRISLADAKKDFDAGDAFFVDTRGKSSYDTEHVKGALNLPLNDFDKLYKSIPKDKKIIAYCS